MDTPEVVKESPRDIADHWRASLKQTAEVDPTVQAAGSSRRSGAASVAVAPPITYTVKASDVLPLVRGLGAVATRAANVSDITTQEAEDIAEPAAHLLSIMAPDTPAWAIPLMTLSARIGQVVVARSDEFAANARKTDKKPEATDPESDTPSGPKGPTIVDATRF